MPILPDSEEATGYSVKAITGAEWNDLLDYIQRITPRGDGSTTYAKATKDGTSISAIDAEVDDGGGALREDMPGRVDFDGKALVTGKEWNKLVDYLQMITPVTDGETATGKSISDGFELSFPPLEEEIVAATCDPGTFYVNVTITGGSFRSRLPAWNGRRQDRLELCVAADRKATRLSARFTGIRYTLSRDFKTG